MVPEENPFVRRHEVAAIIMALAGSGAGVIERKNFGGDKCGVQPVSHQITTNSCDDEPGGIERLSTMKSNGAQCGRPKRSNSYRLC